MTTQAAWNKLGERDGELWLKSVVDDVGMLLQPEPQAEMLEMMYPMAAKAMKRDKKVDWDGVFRALGERLFGGKAAAVVEGSEVELEQRAFVLLHAALVERFGMKLRELPKADGGW